MTTRTDVWRLRGEFFRWDREERRRILEDHMKAYHERSRELQAKCLEAGGHFWRFDDLNPTGLPIHRCGACTASHIGELPQVAEAEEVATS